MLFISVLLCGFAVKTLMLCPGIFSPYRHAHEYDPTMTESFRYIVVISPVAGGDENKGTMLRNIIGTVSCMPPESRCRYHVVVNDEGHRNEMKLCWGLFCNIIAAVPNFGDDSYESNVLEFTHVWCIETKKLTLPEVGGKVKQLDDKVVDRLCGKTALRKLRKESRWRGWDAGHLASLEAAMEVLSDDLKTNYNKFTLSAHNLDNIGDWAPKDPSSLPLRMHYTSRAKPLEDSRNIMVQHVAVGSWYYKVPKGSSTEDWLHLRSSPKEMVYALPDNDEDTYQVPLRSSHGKAGGLNFVDNYMTLVARRRENLYGDDRDEAPTLYAIADARHQFQPDFMLSCVPCFFKENGDLNPRVAFTQAPQHYPEYADSNDYMDYNNAQFFRLNAMIRNCCGGCSSCGTNGMWLLPSREDDTIWEKRVKRVRDQDSKRREQLIEREQFHTSCKIEDTASSLDQVLVGRHSHFVNRKLSFGMAKAPTDFIGAQQRWVEGAVTLALQWFSGTADSHGAAARNGWMLWCTVLMFGAFLAALLRLVTSRSETSIFVEYGALSATTFEEYFDPLRDLIWGFIDSHTGVMELLGANTINISVYSSLFRQFLIWSMTCIFCFLLLFIVTMFAKVISRCCCGAVFPNEMRWWGRLLISMDNLTYFVWFWTSFFWVGFNYYTALCKMHFHFNNLGMMAFMLVINCLHWTLIACNSFRYSVMESVDANEVAALSMDNIWRANQLFFMTGPIQLFSLVRGIGEYIKYKFYGQDIGGWSGGDLGKISVNIVKYWTTFLLMSCVGVWVCYVVYAHKYANSFAACVVITMISLDVLHPCVFLWLGNVTMPDQERERMTCLECLMTLRWWQVWIKDLILNNALTSFLKFLAPAYFLALPIMSLFSSYFGLTGAYMLVAMGPGH
uniref:Chitin synthase n=1 Tax=Alexandrium catenella TaxID=2925 RepID=A0A7S1Q2K6_ALECA